MLAGILQEVVLGFVLTAIPGAVVLEATRRALSRRSVLSFLGGNFLGVVITILITVSGLSVVLKNTSWSHLFYLLSGATLLYIGLTSIASKGLIKPAPVSRRKSKKPQVRSGGIRAFITGFILAVANPVSILFWVTMIGRYLNNHDNYTQIASNSFAILLGGVIFYVVLLVVIGMTHKLISQRYIVMLTDVFGVVILAYGGFITYKAF